MSEIVELKDLLEKSEGTPSYLEILGYLQEFYRKSGGRIITGISTGFDNLDQLTYGLHDSELIVLASRPGMGKTTLALSIAVNICKMDKTVGFLSLESSEDQLVHRIMTCYSEVCSTKINDGSLSGVEFQRVIASAHELIEKKFIIHTGHRLNVDEICDIARSMKINCKIEILFIDYLQLIEGTNNSPEYRYQDLVYVSRQLKNLSKELDIPVICLSQISSKVEDRPGHRPYLSDLREAGAIENDADVVLFLLRRDYYDPIDRPGLAELIVAKNRNYKVGIMQLVYQKEIFRFSDYTPISQLNLY